MAWLRVSPGILLSLAVAFSAFGENVEWIDGTRLPIEGRGFALVVG